MPDAVALTSVISSGAVALGGLWVSYRSGRDQRAHEKALAYEERAWEKKSEGLFSAISTARTLVDTLRNPNEGLRNTVILFITEARWRLDELVPVIEAYASTECREAFGDLREILREATVDPLLEMRAVKAREEKEAAIEAQDFPGAARARDVEREAIHAAFLGLGIDVLTLATRAERLIDVARRSVRGED